MINPLAGFTEDFDRPNEDLHYPGINDINYYVEDRSKGVLYEIILEKIFEGKNLKFQVFDSFNGKKGVSEKALKKDYLNDGSEHLFLLDKDFNDKYPNRDIDKLCNKSFNFMKKIDGIKFLKKYSIENYLINYDGFKKKLQIKSLRLDEIKELEINDILEICENIVEEIAPLFCFNNFYNLNSKQKILTILNNDLKFREGQPYKYLNELTTQYCENLDGNCSARCFNGEFKRIKEIFCENDIPGKEVLELIKSHLNFLTNKNINQENLYKFLAMNISPVNLNELKKILIPKNLS